MRTQPYSIETVKSAGFEHNWEKYYKLKPGDVFVEVGAFWGRYALIAAKRRCSHIILIEPSPENIATIEYLVIKEKLNNVTVVKKAISNEKGELNFDISGNPAGHCVDSGNPFVDIGRKETIERNRDTLEYTKIQKDTLDNILTELNINYVNLLASDCEGEEAHLLEGAEKFLNQKRILNVAIGAYHHDIICKDVIKNLNDKGYKDVVCEEGVVYGRV